MSSLTCPELRRRTAFAARRRRPKANPLDNFALAMKGKVEGLRMDQNQEIVTRRLNDPQFQEIAFRLLVRRIYDEIRAGGRER